VAGERQFGGRGEDPYPAGRVVVHEHRLGVAEFGGERLPVRLRHRRAVQHHPERVAEVAVRPGEDPDHPDIHCHDRSLLHVSCHS
jgi:hypothetical protein